MKSMMMEAGKEEKKEGGVFEYKPKLNDTLERNIDQDYDIEINEGEDEEELGNMDLNDEEETPLEYSAENLEDFMISLRNQ
jgi:hypothetical protein